MHSTNFVDQNIAKIADLYINYVMTNRWENNKTQPSKLAKKQLEQFINSQQQQGMLKHD